MQKVKHDFQLADKEISSLNVYMIQNCFTFLDRNSCLMFKLSITCSTLNESIVIQKSNSIAIAQWNKHTRNNSIILKRRYLVLNEEERKEENNLTVEMVRRSNYDLNLRKPRINIKKITAEPQSGSKWKTCRLSAMILHSQFNLTIHSFEDKSNFAVYNKDCRNFWTPRKHARHPTKISHNHT